MYIDMHMRLGDQSKRTNVCQILTKLLHVKVYVRKRFGMTSNYTYYLASTDNIYYSVLITRITFKS